MVPASCRCVCSDTVFALICAPKTDSFRTHGMHEFEIVQKLKELGFVGKEDILKKVVVDPRPKKMKPKHYYDEV